MIIMNPKTRHKVPVSYLGWLWMAIGAKHLNMIVKQTMINGVFTANYAMLKGVSTPNDK